MEPCFSSARAYVTDGLISELTFRHKYSEGVDPTTIDVARVELELTEGVIKFAAKQLKEAKGSKIGVFIEYLPEAYKAPN